MSEYRNRSTGEVKSQGAIRKSMPNTSLPRIWTEEICDFLGVDPVEVVNQPKASGEYKVFDRNGVAETNGVWSQAYVERDMFADYVNGDGVTVTKASQEEAYTAAKTAEAAAAVRATRDGLIASCDWMAIKAFEAGTTVGTEWATYRQALRDVSAQAGFPNDITWPTQPE